jgi:hypothetical protein
MPDDITVWYILTDYNFKPLREPSYEMLHHGDTIAYLKKTMKGTGLLSDGELEVWRHDSLKASIPNTFQEYRKLLSDIEDKVEADGEHLLPMEVTNGDHILLVRLPQGVSSASCSSPSFIYSK